MKKLLAILSICVLPALAFAQSDTTKKDPVFFVDGQKITKAQLTTMSPDDIDMVEVIKSADKTKTYGEDATNGVVLITTKKHVIDSYQKIFSAKSKQYAAYLATTSGIDKEVLYVLNGTPLLGDAQKNLDTLYHIKPEEIKEFRFTKNPVNGEHDRKYVAAIVTAAK